MDTLLQDIRYGIRMLLKNPGFTTIAVLTLALGIGANTAIFSVVNAVLLRPLPYSQPENLVAIFDSLPTVGFPRAGLSEAEFFRLRSESRSFSDVATWNWNTVTLRGTGEPDRVPAVLASANLFRIFGMEVALGRSFNAEEELAGKNSVVVLSHGFWQRRFGGDPNIVGRTLLLDGSSYTVIGVLPASFKLPPEMQADTHIDIWMGYGFDPAKLNPGSHGLSVIGRLQTGVTLKQAEAETNTIINQVIKDHSDYYPPAKEFYNFLEPLQRSIVGDVRPALLVLLGAVGVVLLIACANVANLLLARSRGRQKEMAVRAALGASRGRIVKQLLIENLLLAILGGGIGLLLTPWALAALVAVSPENIPRLTESSLDLRVMGFALLVSLFTVLVFGLAPALQAVKFDLNSMMKEGGRVSGQRSQSRLRQALFVLETSLALVLLVAAGLLIRSFWQLQQVNTGFRPDHLLTMRLTPPGSAYQDNQKLSSLYERMLERIKTLPGVESAAVADPLPISGSNMDTVIEVEGRPLDMSKVNLLSSDFRTASPEYFQTIGMKLVKGKFFADSDLEGSTPVAVINEKFANNQWPDEDPIGKRFRLLDAPPDKATSRFVTVVGVVANAKNRALNEETRQEVIIPLAQHAADYGTMGLQQSCNLLVRTTADPVSLANTLRQEVRSIESDMVITQVKTMDQFLEAAVVQQRFNMFLLGIFAVLALGLGAIGIYGVIAYSVAQRTHEIGVRMALGAQAKDILKLVVGEGMLLVLIGTVIGLAGAFAVTRMMSSLLFGITATDPLTFVLLPLLLIVVAFLACYIPARRATKVDPMVVLRYE